MPKLTITITTYGRKHFYDTEGPIRITTDEGYRFHGTDVTGEDPVQLVIKAPPHTIPCFGVEAEIEIAIKR